MRTKELPQTPLVAFDPSTTCMGWADANDHGTIQGKGDRPTRLSTMAAGIRAVLTSRPKLVVYYRPFARGADATRCAWGVVGLIEAIANDFGCAVTDVDEGKVRAFHKVKERDRAGLKAASLEKAKMLRTKAEGMTEDEAEAILLYNYTILNAKGL